MQNVVTPTVYVYIYFSTCSLCLSRITPFIRCDNLKYLHHTCLIHGHMKIRYALYIMNKQAAKKSVSKHPDAWTFNVLSQGNSTLVNKVQQKQKYTRIINDEIMSLFSTAAGKSHRHGGIVMLKQTQFVNTLLR